MEQPKDRLNLIRTALITLDPITLTIHDESHLHKNHGSAKGGGHFSIYIVSKAFIDKTAVQCHQMIYDALGDLMSTEIHAISINAKSPEE